MVNVGARIRQDLRDAAGMTAGSAENESFMLYFALYGPLIDSGGGPDREVRAWLSQASGCDRVVHRRKDRAGDNAQGETEEQPL